METMSLKAEPRTELGTRPSRALRERGYLPGITYGHGDTPTPIRLMLHDIEVALAHGVRTLHVEVGGKSNQYLIKEVQYDHLGTTLIHIDLTRVDATERVKVRVGIELRGIPKGTHEGGMLDQVMADLEVECMVTNIPGTLHPIVTHLEVGESLLVSDLELPPGVVAVVDGEERVATVRALVAAKEEVEEVAAEGEEEAAQPEVIGRQAKEEGEGEGGS